MRNPYTFTSRVNRWRVSARGPERWWLETVRGRTRYWEGSLDGGVLTSSGPQTTGGRLETNPSGEIDRTEPVGAETSGPVVDG